MEHISNFPKLIKKFRKQIFSLGVIAAMISFGIAVGSLLTQVYLTNVIPMFDNQATPIFNISISVAFFLMIFLIVILGLDISMQNGRR